MRELQLLLTRENRYENLDTRNNVLINLLIYQGLTSDEIIRLNVQDIHLDAGTIYIKASSNLNSRRLQLLAKQILLFSKYINEVRPRMLRSATDKLIIGKLGKPIAVDSVHAMIQPLKPLFPDKNLNPKTIRMSVICNWLNETYLKPLNGGKKGGSFTDISATKDGRKIHVNTVDTYKNGTITKREMNNANRIRKQVPNEHLVLIPKK